MLIISVVYLIYRIVRATAETKLSRSRFPCNSDPDYNFYKCTESYFHGLRGCQYPWNVYKDLKIAVCSNFTKIKLTTESLDENMGNGENGRIFINPSELVTKTKCLPPCKMTRFDYSFENWPIKGERRLFQIVFADFKILTRTEYVACDWTCIIGEFGGNLGFFLGGSLISFINLILESLENLFMVLQRRSTSPKDMT